MNKKFYGIKVGRKIGVFDNWDTVKELVDGYPNAKYKSFKTKTEAWDYVRNDLHLPKSKSKKKDVNHTPAFGLENLVSAVAFTDGSYDGNTKTYSYGAVVLWKNRIFEMSQRFKDKRDTDLRNVAGELKGAMRAMKFAKANKIQYLDLYHDYEGVAAWADGKWKANLPLTQEYVEFVSDIRKTVKIRFIWVKGHSGNFYNDLADRLASNAKFTELRKEG